MGFTRLNLHKKILERLEKLEFSSPTPIQEQAIPHILEGKDMLASADTGTGKTAAFLLPAIHMLAERETPSQGPSVLILSPTRELATQIEKEVTRFSSGLKNINSVVVFGGASWSEQVKKVSKPHDILVATPGRLIDLMEKNKVDLSQVDLLVIDEADRMLDMGFVEPVNLIASKTNPDRQTLLFSATLKGPVLKLCANLTISPVRVEIEKKEMEVENIQEHFYYTHDIAHKHRLLTEILQKDGVDQAIIFTSTKRAADELTDRLSDEGFETAALHGDMKQRQRDRTLRYLHAKKIRVLVATDVAARGIDVATITHVINFDLPMQVEDYIHRIGRTGRAGATGEAHSFASKRDRGVVKDIEKLTKKSYEIYMDSKGDGKERDSQRPSKSRSNDREFKPRKSFKDDNEFRERKPFSKDREFQGERKEFKERRPFQRDREFQGERREFKERRPFSRDREFQGERSDFRERKPFSKDSEFQGEKREFKERRPFSRDREFQGERSDFRERKPFSRDREFQGERSDFRERRPFRKERDSDAAGQEGSFKKSFSGEKSFQDAGMKIIGKSKKSKSFSFGKYDLESPNRFNKPKRPTGPKRGKKVFTSPKRGRR